jgi:hypothetical protein
LEVREILLQHDQQVKLAAQAKELAKRGANSPQPVQPAGMQLDGPAMAEPAAANSLFRLPPVE